MITSKNTLENETKFDILYYNTQFLFRQVSKVFVLSRRNC